MSAQGGRRNRSPLHVRSSGAPFPVRGMLNVCVLYLLNKRLFILLCFNYNLHIVFSLQSLGIYFTQNGQNRGIKSLNVIVYHCMFLNILRVLYYYHKGKYVEIK